MESNLFKKYKNTIQQRDETKEKIIILIKKNTNVLLKPEEITIEGKKIMLNISSIKRSVLIKNKINEILLNSGYQLF